MNVLYIAFKDFSKLHFGASKKVISECRAMEQAGHTVTLMGRNHNQTVTITTDGALTKVNEHNPFPVAKLQPLFDKKNEIRDVIAYIKDKTFDFCYIRYDLCDGDFMRMVKHIRQVCPTIYIEIPTYPYDKEYAGRVNGIRLKIDAHHAKKLKNYVSRIITFYKIPDDSFYGIPCINVPNGFDFDEVELIREDAVPATIEIAAVSSMRIWHGYERMIEGMHRYYAGGGTRNLILHLVGDGRECGKYKALCDEYRLGDHVVFHGAMHGKELDNLLEQCTLGIDSLGRHRTGVDVLSSLKSREYGAKGIPFINSCKIDIVEEDFPYMLQVPADESPVDVESVVSFFDKVYEGGSRLAVAKEVRAYIEHKSDMSAVMRQVLNTIE